MDEQLHGLRVLLTTDAVGGVWTYSLDLARELGRNGIETVLAVLGPEPAPEARATALAIPALELVITGLPLDWLADTPDQLLDAGRNLAELARERRCALAQIHAPALAAARSFDIPLIAVHHSCLATWWQAVKPPEEDMPEDFRWRSAMVARGIAAASQVVAPTTAHAHAIAAAYALSSPPMVIRNGRAPAPPAAGADDLPPPFIFSSGRLWDEGKNVASLNRAAALIDTPIAAAGAVEAPDGSAAEFPALRLLGSLAEQTMRQWLSMARCYVSLAVYEPFGLGVLEAAQAGCPLVLSDIPSFRELWAGAALFVPARDEQEIARTLSRLLGDDGMRNRLARRAHYRAVLYSAEGMGREMMRLYALHLALHRPRGARAA